MHRLQTIQRELLSSPTSSSHQTKPKDFSYYRNASKLNKQQLKQKIYGHNWAYRDRLLQIIKSHPQIYKHYHLLQSSRPQQRAIIAQILFANKKLVNLSYDKYLQDTNILTLLSNAVVIYDHGFSVKNGVHVMLYSKTIFNLGKERHAHFIQRATKFQDIGCFGLTQLTHGSNVKGIVTQAHYDHHNQQFIINSPKRQSMKFWIGAAAQLANMSIIWAQLYIDGICYGVHAYIVPLRDPQTHKLLPGILIGDCGPKQGNNQIDNGFILFDHVKIPVENQLDRISGVNQHGKFFSIVQGQQKRFGIQLAALSGGRFIVALNGSTLALQALTIAIRYACVRRQFVNPPQTIQNLLIQYPLTRRRLMPLLAQTVVYLSGNLDISQVWDKNFINILNPQNTVIQQLHAISSTTKSKSSWFATETIKQCRQVLGGHGYSYFSKLGVLYNDNDINCTWEGDNNILLQQATKYVLDCAAKLMKGKSIDSQILSFLTNPPTQSDIQYTQKSFLDFSSNLKFLQYCLNQKLQQMGIKLLSLKQLKMKNMDIWNNSQVYLGKTIALILGDLFYLQSAIAKIQKFSDLKTKSTFISLTHLWFLKILKQNQFVNGIHHPTIQRLIRQLSDQITYQSLGILQSLSTCDQVIGSPFACPDGFGFQKYVRMVRAQGRENQRVPYWQILKQKTI